MKKIKFLAYVLVISFFSCSENNEIIPQNEVKQNTKTFSEKIKLERVENILPTNWLKFISDSVYVSQLSIPGTHESAAMYETLPNTAKCQNLSIEEQLNIGVRYLDIRCRHFRDKFSIHHGFIYQHKNFSDILNYCKSFLKENPSEFIIMSVKEEYSSAENTRPYYETFEEYIKNEGENMLYLKDSIPMLQEVRGKIILIRRFYIPFGKVLGIPAEFGWLDNKEGLIIQNKNSNLFIQDKYKVNDNNHKWDLITTLFEKAIHDSVPKHLYLNNTSGYKPIIFGIPNISIVSNDINNRLKKHIEAFNTSKKRQKKLGIVGMDFINAYQAKQIYMLQR